MVANPVRRRLLLDAALLVLGRDGARALSHRAVDRAAGVPEGTSANYVPSRTELLLAAAERAFERLAPAAERLAELERLDGLDAVEAYVRYAVERLLAAPHLALALIELRLAAARDAELAKVLGAFLGAGLREDAAFHERRRLPGGRSLVLDLHAIADGVVLDALTVPYDPDVDAPARAASIARRLARASVADSGPRA